MAFEKGLDGAQKKLTRFGKDMQRISSRMTGLGAALTVGLTAPLAAVGVKMTQMAIDAEEMKSAFKVSFGTMAKDVEGWAVKTGDAMGRSTEEMQQSALTMHGLFKAGGPATAQTKALAQQFAVLAQDLSSFHNVDPTDALEALKSGLSGEAEPLRRFNVYLNENAVRLQAVQMGLGKMKGELTEVAKIQARAALIMRGTTEAQGDVARTADSAANQIRRSKAQWQELAVVIGSKIIPLLTPVVKALGDMLQGFGKLNPVLQGSILALGAIAFTIGPVLIGIGSLIGAVGAITTALGAATGAAATFGVALAAFMSVAAAVVVTVAALTAGIGLLMYAQSDAAIKADANKRAHERLDPILNTVRDSMTKAAAATGELRKSHLEAADAAFIRGEAELEAARKTLAAARASVAAAKRTDGNLGLQAMAGGMPGYNTGMAELGQTRAEAALKAAEDELIKAGLGKRRSHKGYGTTFHVTKPSDAFREAEAVSAVASAVRETGEAAGRAKKPTRDFADELDRLNESLLSPEQQSAKARVDDLKLLDDALKAGAISLETYFKTAFALRDKWNREDFQAISVTDPGQLNSAVPDIRVFGGQVMSEEQVASLQNQMTHAFRGAFDALRAGGAKGLFEYLADSFANRLLDRLSEDLTAIFSKLLSQMSTVSNDNGSGWGAIIGAVGNWFAGSQGFATGGSFTVGGSGRADSKYVGMRLSPGEMVDVRKPGQTNDNGGGVSVHVSKSPYFDVHVERIAASTAAPMASAAYTRAVADAPRNMQRQSRSRLG